MDTAAHPELAAGPDTAARPDVTPSRMPALYLGHGAPTMVDDPVWPAEQPYVKPAECVAGAGRGIAGARASHVRARSHRISPGGLRGQEMSPDITQKQVPVIARPLREHDRRRGRPSEPPSESPG